MFGHMEDESTCGFGSLLLFHLLFVSVILLICLELPVYCMGLFVLFLLLACVVVLFLDIFLLGLLLCQYLLLLYISLRIALKI